jgi:hypothetical protein
LHNKRNLSPNGQQSTGCLFNKDVWWDDFYTPMQGRIEESHGTYEGDAEAASILDKLAREPDMHRRYSEYYSYEFFVARRRHCGKR